MRRLVTSSGRLPFSHNPGHSDFGSIVWPVSESVLNSALHGIIASAVRLRFILKEWIAAPATQVRDIVNP